jgi:hypothetical protein
MKSILNSCGSFCVSCQDVPPCLRKQERSLQKRIRWCWIQNRTACGNRHKQRLRFIILSHSTGCQEPVAILSCTCCGKILLSPVTCIITACKSGSTRRRATQHFPWDLLTCLKRYDGINNIARSSCLQFKQYSTKLLSPILATRFRQTLTMCCLWAAYWWNSRRKLALSLMNRSSGAICRTRHVCLDECVKYALPQCVDKLTWTYLDLYYNNKNYNNKKKLRRINLFYNKNINLKIDSNTCMGR